MGGSVPSESETEDGGVLRRARVDVVETDGGLSRALALSSVIQAVFGDQAAPRTIDRYRLDGVLGRGGMGTVFRAHDPRLDRDVAIKVHRQDVESTERAHARLLREARAIAALDHPNVIAVYDAGFEQDQLWVAMQYMEGGSLVDHTLHADHDWRHLLDLMIAVGHGLAAAHAKGLVHRDVKPDNILLDHRGRPKLADFGLASLGSLVESETNEPLASPTRAGTPRFMAPEVLEGLPATAASDQYSWCVSFEWVCAHVGQRPPAHIMDVLERGLHARPERRWPDMSALLDALEEARAPVGDPATRALLLERIGTAWIGGVLEPALAMSPFVALPLEMRIDAEPARPSDAPASVVSAPTSTLADVDVWRAHPGGREPNAVVGAPAMAVTLDEDGRALDRYFQRSHRGLVLLGQPGAGKTTAVLAWVRRRIEVCRHHADARVPIVFSLAAFRGKTAEELSQWCAERLISHYGLSRVVAATWIRNDASILVFDGLDEVPVEHRDDAARAVHGLHAQADHAIVLVCRVREYEALTRPPRLGAVLELPPLDDDTLRAFGIDHAEAWAATETVRAPLWAVLANEHQAERHDALERFVLGALARGPAPAPAGSRERLAALAALLRRRGTSQFALEELQFDAIASPMWRRLAIVLFVVVTTALMTAANVASGRAAGRPLAAGFVFGFASVASVWILDRTFQVRMVERLRWTPRAVLGRIPLAVGFSTAVGLLFGLVVGTPGMSACLGAQYGVLISLVIGLEPSTHASPIRPNAGFWTSLRHAAALGCITAVLFGVFFSTLSVPMLVPLFGPPGGGVIPAELPTMLAWEMPALSGTVVAAVYGGKAAATHLAIRWGLAGEGTLPARLVPWLDDMTQRGILRRVGGSYLFMHAALLEHLADPAVGTSETSDPA